MSPQPLWKIEQVSEYLNVGKTTIYEMVSRGELTAIKIGRATRFNPTQVLEVGQP